MNLGNADFNRLDIAAKANTKTYSDASSQIDINDDNSALAIICRHIKPGSTVLDVGCSSGYIGDYLRREKDCAIDGIDNDEVSLEQAASRKCYRSLTQIDLNTCSNPELFGLKSSTYDYIIFADVLEHLVDPRQTLVGFLPLLKSEGEILVSIPEVGNADIFFNLMAGNFNYNEFGILDNTHLRFFTQKSFMQWVRNISKSLSGQKLQVSLIGSTYYESTFIKELRQTKKFLRTSIDPESMRLQNIFAAFRSDIEPLTLNPSKNFLDVITKNFEEIDEQHRRFEQLSVHLLRDNALLTDEIISQNQAITSLTNKLVSTEAILHSIYNSRGWRILVIAYRVKHHITLFLQTCRKLIPSFSKNSKTLTGRANVQIDSAYLNK